MKLNLDSKVVKYALIVVCVILLAISYGQRRTRKHYQEAAQLPYYQTQVEQIEDGTYTGKCYTSFIHVQLLLTVENHKITDIQILENKGSVGKKVAPILNEMIEQNKTNVRAVKGEELASLAFVSCADDALHHALVAQGDYIPLEDEN